MKTPLLAAAACLVLASGPAGAAVLTLNKETACPGTTIEITGDAWPEPPPSCFYEFSFDTTAPGVFEVVAPNQPNGLFGPPNSSFVVPANAVPGPHTVRVRLIISSTSELVHEETQPLSIAKAEFEGATNCKKKDSGFDSTADTAESPWLSVAVGQKTKVAKIKVTPNAAGPKTRLKSSDESKMTVKPEKPGGGTTTLTVKGIAVGEAKVEVKDEEEEGDCGDLDVAVYNKKVVKVAVHIVQLDGCPKPKLKPKKIKAKKFEKQLNKIWDQAAITFKVSTKHFLGKKAIKGADDDGDCVADEKEPPPGVGDPVTFGPELQKIHDAAKTASADVNVYFVQNYQVPLAAYHDVPNVVFAMSFQDQSPQELANDLLIAHELGHHFTLGHCDSDNNCGGLGTDALMHSANTGCILRKGEWDTSNGSVP